MSLAPIYTATADERELATAWHGGQASMLYAVSSTGALSLGTIRPYNSTRDGLEPMTDAEWRWDLACRLEREVRNLTVEAREDHPDDAQTARKWADKLRPIVDGLESVVDAEWCRKP